jgi:O-antigen ligase
VVDVGEKQTTQAVTLPTLPLPQFQARGQRTGLTTLGVVVLALLMGLAIAVVPLGQVALLVGAAIGVGVVTLIIAEPTIGLALTLFAGPFEPLESIMFHLPISSGQALLLLTLSAWVVRMVLRRRADLRTGSLFWPLAALLGVGALSFFAASSFELWAKECVKWVEVLVVYVFTLSQIRENTRARTLLLGAILVSAFFEAALGIYQFGLRGTGPAEFLIFGTRYRAYGTFEQPNPFGGYMGLTWPLAAAIGLFSLRESLRLLSSPLRRTRAAYGVYALAAFSLLVAVMGALALALSWSRGAWLGAGAAVVMMFIVALRKPVASLSIIAVVLVVVVAFNVVDLLPASLRSRLTDFTQEFSTFDVRGVTISSANYSIIERLAHWQAAENMIVDHPWLGVGFGNYAAVYDQYRTLNWPIALGHAHNYYLNVWAETGLVGLLVYLFLWGWIFYRTIKLYAVSNRPQHVDSPSTQLPFLAPAIALGMVGAWTQLSIHQLVDNLYVANIFLLISVYFGIIDSFSLAVIPDRMTGKNR